MFFTRALNKRKVKRSLERTFKKLLVKRRKERKANRRRGRNMGPELPMELLDMIMYHNHEDKAALMASSMVSSQWQGPAQRRLFHSIKITIGYDHTPPDCELGFYFEFFSDVPTLGAFVATLHISAAHRFTRSLLADSDSTIARLVGVLPTLQLLSFENILSTPRGSPQTGSLLIKNLTLRSISSINMRKADQQEFLKLFSVQETLELNLTYVSAPNGGPHIARSMPVRHLKIKNSLDCFPCFDRGTSFPRLRALSFDVTNVGRGNLFNLDPLQLITNSTLIHYYDKMNRFMRRYGANLEFFRLNMRHLITAVVALEDRQWTVFQLDAVCPNLQSLHIGFELGLKTGGSLEPLLMSELTCTIDFLITIISSAPRTLTTVVFGISMTLSPPGESDKKPPADTVAETNRQWKRLAQALEPARFGRLTAVRFVQPQVRSSLSEFKEPLDPVYQQLLAGNFENLNKKGLLCFE